MKILNIFYELARQHKRVKGFRYNKAYEKGAGNDSYPLVWVDDPITGQTLSAGVLRYTINVDFLGLPLEQVEDQVAAIQAQAFNTGLSFAERLRSTKALSGFGLDGYNFVSLRNYYDDNAAGYRFTFYVVGPNPVDRCAEDFDEAKVMEGLKVLPDFLTDNPDGCAIFNDKKTLPNFSL